MLFLHLELSWWFPRSVFWIRELLVCSFDVIICKRFSLLLCCRIADNICGISPACKFLPCPYLEYWGKYPMILRLKIILDWHLGLTKVLNYTLCMCMLGKVLTGTFLFSSSLYLCFRTIMKTAWICALQTKIQQHYGSRSSSSRHIEWLILWYPIFISAIVLGKPLMQKSYHI